MIELGVIRNDTYIASKNGEDEVYVVFEGEYSEGDELRFIPDGCGFYVLDLGLGKNLVYSNGSPFDFQIPFGEKKLPYPPQSFTGEIHYLYGRKAYDFELGYGIVSKNIYDHSRNETLYPHSRANIETRGESVFASRNAFDGFIASSGHGKWPYESWGINRDPDAELFLDFGRDVKTDRIVFYTRADFPHDAWWDRVTVEFSDGSSTVLNLVKKDGAQIFEIKERRISSLTVKNLIKSDDPSPFPALIQLEVYGK